MDRPFDVLLLDFGGVVLAHPVELHHRTEELLGLEPGTLDWLGAVDPTTDELWRQTMNGDLPEGRYWDLRAAELARLAGRAITRDDYFDLLYDEPYPGMTRPEATDVVKAAKGAGYGVSVLTNDLSSFRGPEWPAKVEFFALADHIIDCGKLGFLKPDPRAYAAAEQITGASAGHMLFVDDLPTNVEGATAAGMTAVFFDVGCPADSWRAVAEMLGLHL